MSLNSERLNAWKLKSHLIALILENKGCNHFPHNVIRVCKRITETKMHQSESKKRNILGSNFNENSMQRKREEKIKQLLRSSNCYFI